MLTRVHAGAVCVAMWAACTAERPAAEARPPCDARMVQLDGFCIDRFEAFIDARGGAQSARGQMPAEGLSYVDAEAACRASGYRLCTGAEYDRACGEGPYPYGPEFMVDRCNAPGLGAQLTGRAVAAAGAYPGCESAEGVFDLSGNLGEWVNQVDGSGDLRQLRGGSYTSYPSYAKCRTEQPTGFQPPDAAFSGQGFRCCADARR
ncbi:MAG: SUMF1/EgtB/PvdO family nonheme iron enzyme [Myxococcota bacterium]